MGRGQQLDRVKQEAKQRTKEGISRVREGFLQSLQIVVAGVGAYLFSERVLGHFEPIFAATAAVVSLGYITGATHARRILEVSLGVALGILLGDLILLTLGKGLGQAALAMLISILVARFLDDGILFTIQMGVQSWLVVLLPHTVDNPFSRSLDGIVGGVFAFLLMFFFPLNPHRRPRQDAQQLMEAFSQVFDDSARAIRSYQADQAWTALAQARQLHPLYDACEKSVITSRGMAQLSMTGRSSLKELEEYSQILGKVDYAIRNLRVLNRRLSSTISNVQLSEQASQAIAQALEQLADAISVLGRALASSQAQERQRAQRQAQQDLTELAQVLEPRIMGVRSMEGEALVLILRSLLVDLLEASGLTHQQAVDCLAPLGEAMTEHAPPTQSIPVITPQMLEASRADTASINLALRAREQEPRRDVRLPLDPEE